MLTQPHTGTAPDERVARRVQLCLEVLALQARVVDQYVGVFSCPSHCTVNVCAQDFDSSLDRAKACHTLEDSEAQKFTSMAVLECRGCEILAFDPKGVWSCKGSESGTVFNDIELSLAEQDDGWTDYDEKVPSSVIYVSDEQLLTPASNYDRALSP